MPVPWLRLVDLALGVTNFAQTRTARANAPGDPGDDLRMVGGGPALGRLETRLAGVVVAALKEAFDRDSRRLDLERELIEAERQRAERVLKLELMRQAGDRELGRLRLIAGAAIVSWLGTLVFAIRSTGGPLGARLAFGGGLALLLGALASALVAQTNIGDALGRIDETSEKAGVSSGPAGAVAPWLMVIGLAFVGLAVLIT